MDSFTSLARGAILLREALATTRMSEEEAPKPKAPKPPRHRPFPLPVPEARIGMRYVNDRKRGTIRDIRPAGHRDRTQVLFDIVYDDKSKSTVRHEMVGDFETVEGA